MSLVAGRVVHAVSEFLFAYFMNYVEIKWESPTGMGIYFLFAYPFLSVFPYFFSVMEAGGDDGDGGGDCFWGGRNCHFGRILL